MTKRALAVTPREAVTEQDAADNPRAWTGPSSATLARASREESPS